jgi:hypothetical protein
VRKVACKRAQPQSIQETPCPYQSLRTGYALGFQTKSHIVFDLHPGKQAGILEDQRAARHRLILWPAKNPFRLELDCAGCRLDQLRQNPQQRRLAAAAWPNKTDKLARLNGEGYLVQCLHRARCVPKDAFGTRGISLAHPEAADTT